MKVIPPELVTPATLTTLTGVTDPRTAADFNAATTYAYNDTVKDPATYLVYQSKVANNVGNTPSSSSSFWEQIGYHEVVYNAGTTYTAAANQIVSYSRRLYLSLQVANTGHTPDVSPTWWKDIGPTNKWAMFDMKNNAETAAPGGTLTVVLTPGVRINSIGMIGVIADQVTINITSGGVNVYSRTVSFVTRDGIIDAYTYCFNPFQQIDAACFFDLPPITNNVITLVFTRSQGNIIVQALAVGMYVFAGNFQYDDATDDADNYSTITRDDFGNATLVPKRTVPKVSGSLRVPAANMKAVRLLRETLNAVPAIWCGLDDITDYYFPSLILLGVYQEFSIGLKYTNVAVISLQLEGI
jgi:hypothetical protein